MLMTTTTPDEEPQPGAAHSGNTETLLFTMRFTSSGKGARLARKLAVRRMEEWGWPAASDLSCTVSLLVGELAANAVRHGRVPGRGFRLALEARGDVVRIEVSDASPIRPPAAPPSPSADDESGRGLLLVDILATRWGAVPRDPVGKTVWAEVAALDH
ncbi:Histidine kinase-like ATPase domain-containing protein [Streptomyces radiopugnans]|uniref:Histidine kinase-like ATPase domain-containing protein n=2 Tax=Streptomyces radiopugnans TaxID=403935 RepID=A0A1H9BCL8_9ACTN|nr:Histidine kinase-like ATPase domain-containing protein [Streptomyces radiopugnans]